MAWDFITKLWPLYPVIARRLNVPVLRTYELPAE
jgi:hypothetical protein